MHAWIKEKLKEIELYLFIRGEDKSGFGEEIEKKGGVIEENR
jgi:hypothetical protein